MERNSHKEREIIEDWLAEMELVVINHGREPTFVREYLDQRGHLEITAVDERGGRLVIRWEVIDEKTGSDSPTP